MKVTHITGVTTNSWDNKHRNGASFGILIPAFKEEFPTINSSLISWLSCAEGLSDDIRVIILVLVNGPHHNIPENSGLLSSIRGLQTSWYHQLRNKLQFKKTARDTYFLRAFLNLTSNRVTLLLGEHYEEGNNIGKIRDVGCSYLKDIIGENGIIVSTDADTQPVNKGYLKFALDTLKDNDYIAGLTGGFRGYLQEDSSIQTRRLFEYNKVCWYYFSTMTLGNILESEILPVEELLANMPGSNSIFRASIYRNNGKYESMTTGEDMSLSRQLLEQGMYILSDESLMVESAFRPSDRTSYGYGTEAFSVNQSPEIYVMPIEFYIKQILINKLFKHAEAISSEITASIGDKNKYLITLLSDELGGEIMDKSTRERLLVELTTSKGFVQTYVSTNDKAIRIVLDRLREVYTKLSLRDAYKNMLMLLKKRLIEIGNTDYGRVLLKLVEHEESLMLKYGESEKNLEILLKILIQKIRSVTEGGNSDKYEDTRQLDITLVPYEINKIQCN